VPQVLCELRSYARYIFIYVLSHFVIRHFVNMRTKFFSTSGIIFMLLWKNSGGGRSIVSTLIVSLVTLCFIKECSFKSVTEAVTYQLPYADYAEY
jgi:hypothetical protein